MQLSLRIVLSSAIALVTVITAIIAFVPMYLAGVTAVRSSLGDLRRAYVARAANQTQNFLDVPYNVLHTFDILAKRGLIDLNTVNPAERAGWQGTEYDLLTDYSSLMTGIGVLKPLVPNATVLQTDFLYAIALKDLFGLPTAGGVRNGSTLEFSYFSPDGTLTGAPVPTGGVDYSEDILLRYTVYGMDKQFPGESFRWKAVSAGSVNPVMQAVLIAHDGSNKYLGGLQIDISSANVENVLRSLGLRQRGRALSLDANSGIVVGSSSEPSVQLLAGYLNFLDPGWKRMKLKTLYNLTDPLVSEVGDVLGRAFLQSVPAPYDTIVTTQYGRTYVDVLELTGPGLRLRTILIMPEVDFLEDVYAAQRRTIGGVVGAICVMIVLAFVLGHVMTQPFTRLRERMYMTASLQDDDAEDAPSMLTEVRGMQESYQLMRDELGKMKSYLPQSVLTKIQNENQDADDEESEGPMLEQSINSEGQSRTATSPHNSSRQSSGGLSSPVSERLSARSSSVKKFGRVGASPQGLLNTASSLAVRRVTIAFFNLRGFHSYCAHASNADVASMQSHALERIAKHVGDNKGVIDFFQGDHVQASFNAVSVVAGHGKRAAVAALAAVAELKADANALRATVGLSAGNCHVGNVGTSTMKRFCVMGAAVPQAAMLERLTKLMHASVLCPSMMYQELSLELLLRGVGVVPLPGLTRPRAIASVEGSKKLEGEEWMYQLRGAEEADPFALRNKFFMAVANDEADAASRLLVDLRARRESAAVSDMLPEAERLASAMASGKNEQFSDLSDFAVKCFSGIPREPSPL